jgi:hypothetical protein
MARFLKEKYKTYEGARKRAAFENGLARGEYERGDKARHYHYVIVHMPVVDVWRVQRETVKRD